MAEGTALIPIETLNAVAVFGEGGVDDILAKLRADALAEAKDLDISTKAGRTEIASLAFKVARSKTALDEMGKDLVSGLKAQAGKIDAERRRIRDACDALKDEVRKPLTDWEDAEKARVAAHETAVITIEGLALFPYEPASAEIKGRIGQLDAMSARDWQEFAMRASQAVTATRTALQVRLEQSLAREAEETKRQKREREEAAERQRLREAAIAQAAAEAAERDRQRAIQDKANAEARAARAKEALEREKAKREADAKAATERREREKKEAAERAAKQERERIEAEKAKEQAAADRREASERNRRKVCRAISEALVREGGLPNTQADLVLDALVAGKIPHVTITW